MQEYYNGLVNTLVYIKGLIKTTHTMILKALILVNVAK